MLLDQIRIFKLLGRVFSLCLIVCSSCAKEIILKDDIVIDDKIFCVAYCRNDSNKNGLRIYGHELEAKQIKAWIWYKNKYTSLEFSFKNDIDDITYYYTDLKGFVFNANDEVSFKIKYGLFDDSLILKGHLPDSFKVSQSIAYVGNDFYGKLKIDKSEEAAYYLNFSREAGVDNRSPIFAYSNAFSGDYLPFVKTPNDVNKIFDLRIHNDDEFLNGINFPEYQLHYQYKTCQNLQLNQTFYILVNKLSKDDWNYMQTIAENYNNIGNPFFNFYQAKHLAESPQKKILGKVVCSFEKNLLPIQIYDKSEAVLSFKVFDKNNVEVTNNKDYSFQLSDQVPLLKRNDSLITSQNAMMYSLGSCNSLRFQKAMDLDYNLYIVATNSKTLVTSVSNTIVTKINLKKSFVFKLQ